MCPYILWQNISSDAVRYAFDAATTVDGSQFLHSIKGKNRRSNMLKLSKNIHDFKTLKYNDVDKVRITIISPSPSLWDGYFQLPDKVGIESF